MSKALFADLVARKLQREQDKLAVKEIMVPSMGKTLTFKRPDDASTIALIDEIGDGGDTGKIVEAYRKIIYFTCEILQDPELHKAMEITDPLDVVQALFGVADIMRIGADLSDFMGMSEASENIKN